MNLNSISPIDGRYANTTKSLQKYFSEYALIKYRVKVEIEYFLFLQSSPVGKFKMSVAKQKFIKDLPNRFTLADAEQVKSIETKTNHDIKAVEYWIKDQLKQQDLSSLSEWVHFGLTSQDINNTAFPLMIKDAFHEELLPALQELQATLAKAAQSWLHIPMLARTHGQAASPTTLGKEIRVFSERLSNQIKMAEKIPFQGKFGGAVGNLNAHYIAYPKFNWHRFANDFLKDLGLERQKTTTQIEHYDMLAAHFQALVRINNILTDLCKDMWSYISMDYFRQKVVKNEVGSSAMPHKVNPIDFENAEGNLGVSSAMFNHLANKLPISRLQRDLTDSTVLRNIGVPYAHLLLSIRSIEKGWAKLITNTDKIQDDLKMNNLVLAEAIQTILRRVQFPGAYEALKGLTRGKAYITKEELDKFVESLDVSTAIKTELKRLDVSQYIGKV